jgi:hypothetical protein
MVSVVKVTLEIVQVSIVPYFDLPYCVAVLVHNINSYLFLNSKDICFISRAYTLEGTLMLLSLCSPWDLQLRNSFVHRIILA